METLVHFSVITGLVSNMKKSSLFLAGMNKQVNNQLVEITGFTQGSFSIRYLGLLLTSKR
ncbi:hypothetical protein MTR67_019272 [Solanum verrucosum]|uniref:Uncharacterized protein n=1 Tax=Solanum verrucosum TaxID=315347 RepID=A0AAF0QL90_SOLVR|nr:hypothetical protein MTR67_019272 [Solanum verrucosum]